jgi:hypothetical protein
MIEFASPTIPRFIYAFGRPVVMEILVFGFSRWRGAGGGVVFRISITISRSCSSFICVGFAFAGRFVANCLDIYPFSFVWSPHVDNAT